MVANVLNQFTISHTGKINAINADSQLIPLPRFLNVTCFPIPKFRIGSFGQWGVLIVLEKV